MGWRTAVFHAFLLVGLGGLIVVAVIPLNFMLLGLWAWIVRSWIQRSSDSRSIRHTQLAGMVVLVGIAVLAPVKVVDTQMARFIKLPKAEITVAELAEHPWDRFYRYSVSAPESLNGRVIRFPSDRITVGQFVAAIEQQTPLRHRFSHCGNGGTILWGGDCSFGLSFRIPDR